MKLLPRIKPNTFPKSSLGIMLNNLDRIRKEYEQYYHFDKVFVCVDEKTMQVINLDYENGMGEDDEK